MKKTRCVLCGKKRKSVYYCLFSLIESEYAVGEMLYRHDPAQEQIFALWVCKKCLKQRRQNPPQQELSAISIKDMLKANNALFDPLFTMSDLHVVAEAKNDQFPSRTDLPQE